MYSNLSRRNLLTLAAGSAMLPVGTWAQGSPTIKAIVNTTAGSGLDALTRAIQPGLAQALGTAIAIDNQAGASGLIGLQTLSRASADGSTIGFASSNLVIFPNVLKSVPFDVTTDFTPIAMLGDIPLVLVANPSRVPATNAREFIAALKAKPGDFNYASSGSGTILHLATELLLQEVGVKINHIPYKAAAPMLTDTIGGQVDFATAALPAALPHIRSGALRAIGLSTPRRAQLAPEIPTFVEQGLPNVVVQSWHAVLGPKGMAPAPLKRIHDGVIAALNDTTVREALAKQAFVIRTETPEETQATIRRELAKYAKLVKQIGLQAQ